MFALAPMLAASVVGLTADSAASAAERGGSWPPEELARRVAAAAPGEVILVPPGQYRGVITIDKPLVLEGVGRPVIAGFGRGDLLLITAPDVTVRGFDIRGTGDDLDKENCAIRVLAPRATIEDNRLEDVLFGIDLRGAPESVLRRNIIGGKPLDIARRGDGLRLWKSDRSRIEDNTIHDGRDAVVWYSTGVEVRGNLVERSRYGLHLMYSHQVHVERNELCNNSVGLYIMYSDTVDVRDNRFERNRGPSGYGIGLKEVSDFRITHNRISENCVGLYSDDAPFRPGAAVVRANVFSCNTVALGLLPNVKGNDIVDNSFLDNLQSVAVLGRGDLYDNTFDRDGAGNFWSDYGGYDEDQDGIGEWVHEPVAVFGHLLDREPKLAVLRFSPVEQAVELVARAVPAVRPAPFFIDENPRTRPSAEQARALAAGRSGAGLHGDEAFSGFWAAAVLLSAAALAALGGWS